MWSIIYNKENLCTLGYIHLYYILSTFLRTHIYSVYLTVKTLFITVTNYFGNDIDVDPYTSSKSCSKGKRVSYKADWVSMKFSNNTHVEITPWTETVEESEFELGNAQ